MCENLGLKMTGQRRIIARVLSDSKDHPDVEVVYQRSMKLDKNISLATVYRTVRLFEDINLIEKHDFGDGRSRYEISSREHHDHLIDLETGKVIEFTNDEIEELQTKIAKQYGYKLMGHKLELFGIKLDGDKESKGDG
ncbi:MAG: transcriptional repressor [Alphaproteobacteria bacterium]|nr:transcriptional repressor [Alphaproteobacteria bacterium]|tara:strand:- start:6470 stop:6883 length:414 start_codon:yes stop_codon:yes gene_type:complete